LKETEKRNTESDCGGENGAKIKAKTLFGRYGKKQPYYCRF